MKTLTITGRFCYLDKNKKPDPKDYEGLDVLVDVQDCTYIDAWGCHYLLSIWKTAKTLKVIKANKNFMAFIELTRLNQILEIHENVESIQKSNPCGGLLR
jgi:anti-anti-sigma regulatory factor